MLTGWRTLGVASLVSLIGVFETFNWATIVPPGYVGPFMLGLGFVFAGLRAVTKTSVTKKF